MKEDKILKMFFEPERWENALNVGVNKDICRADLQSLAKPETRIEMYRAIQKGKYVIAPPHTAKIPKENPGEFRTVYVNEPTDRIFLHIVNDLLIELTPEMIHPSARAYQKGACCGRIVREISSRIAKASAKTIGWKADLSKYFDSVPLRFIDEAFDKVEQKHGKSKIIDVVRAYYHSDYYFDEDNELRQSYQSLKQGCSVASWLANVLLFHIDEKLSGRKDSLYLRYCDDILYVGDDYEAAMAELQFELYAMEIKLNPKKVEYLSNDRWFRFLGYAIKGGSISLHRVHVKKFQKEIEDRTIKVKGIKYDDALRKVFNFLYRGDGEHAWADRILPYVNVKTDIDELNKFVMDCLRAVITGKKKLGGLGYVETKSGGCVARGIGRNVRMNRTKTGDSLDKYVSIGCMQKARVTSKSVYDTMVNTLSV